MARPASGRPSRSIAIEPNVRNRYTDRQLTMGGERVDALALRYAPSRRTARRRLTTSVTVTLNGGHNVCTLLSQPTLADGQRASLLAVATTGYRGDVERCVDALVERRERYGFSYLSLGADIDAVAPVVARLGGT